MTVEPGVPAIEVRGLTKVYGSVRALDDLSLTVRQGSVFGFLGPNGAGKSTTLSILTGLAHATSGEARILGHDVAAASTRVRALTGYLPDVPAFYGWMTAPEYLRFAGSLFGLAGAPLEERVTALLDLAGLTGVATRVGGFSRGMKQRLGLAQALINAPRVVLLDEPTSALDPVGRKDVLDMIAALGGRTTIFFSTHILADVERVCDEVAIIDRGRLLVQASTHELRAQGGGREIVATLGSASEATRLAGALRGESWVESAAADGETVRLRARDLAVAQRALPAAIAAQGASLVSLETGEASLEEVFVSLVGARR